MTSASAKDTPTARPNSRLVTYRDRADGPIGLQPRSRSVLFRLDSLGVGWAVWFEGTCFTPGGVIGLGHGSMGTWIGITPRRANDERRLIEATESEPGARISAGR